MVSKRSGIGIEKRIMRERGVGDGDGDGEADAAWEGERAPEARGGIVLGKTKILCES
jgi:hypothetical protein